LNSIPERCGGSFTHRDRQRPALRPVIWLFFIVTLTACRQQAAQTAPRGSPPPPQVGVITLRPQQVAVTAELPGRTAASKVAEVRPQVTGIVKARLFEEGHEVKAGDPLYQIDPAPYQAALDAASAAQSRSEATVISMQSRYERQQDLIRSSVASRQTLEDAIAALAQSKADLEATKANVEAARINLANTTIAAPIEGRTDRSVLTQGALVAANQAAALTTVRTLDPMNVDLSGSSTGLLNWRQAIREGRLKPSSARTQVRLRLENGARYPHEGEIAFAEANINESTGTFALRASFPNPDRILWPGMYVRATIEEGVSPNSFLVPQRAVTRDTRGDAVAMVVTAQGKAEQRTLTVARNIGTAWLVTAGVSDGDRVIVEGMQLVKNGQDVDAVDVTLDDATGEVRNLVQNPQPASVPAAGSGSAQTRN
jgi:membrane fusion protein, multidrug efflux system